MINVARLEQELRAHNGIQFHVWGAAKCKVHSEKQTVKRLNTVQ